MELAEHLGCPVISEPFIADLGFPSTHVQYAGKVTTNRDLVDHADLVLLVGAELTESGYGTAFAFADGTVPGSRVGTPDELEAALKEAFQTSGPALVEISSTKEEVEDFFGLLDQ